MTVSTTTKQSTNSKVQTVSDNTIISISDLSGMLLGVKSASFVHFTTSTEPAMNKTGNPFHGKVRKIGRYTGIIGNWDYSRSVNNQLARENKDETFVPEPRKWGERIPGTTLVRHKESLYLEVKIEKVFDVHYVDLQGNTLDDSTMDELNKWIKKSVSPSTQNELEKKIILRDFKLDSIIEIHMNNKIFIVQR